MGRFGSVLAPMTVGMLGQVYGLEVDIGITAILFAICGIILKFMPETYEGTEPVPVAASQDTLAD